MDINIIKELFHAIIRRGWSTKTAASLCRDVKRNSSAYKAACWYAENAKALPTRTK